MFAWVKRKEIPASNFKPVSRFAVLVAAHNEEKVISNIVHSLKCLKYPKELYDIFVIADNCSDNTAAIASKCGAKVCERFDPVKRGKGFSLEWMFKKIFEMEVKYDAVCVLDADNLVSPNFLMEMNKQLCMGHKVIQGYLDSKNPSDSWISGNNSIAFWVSNRLFQLPRYYLGLSCVLGGTGFVVATSVLKEFGWGATCLTEDLEFSLRLVMRGMKVYWSHEAVIYDEKPLTIAQSWRQRKRWMQGHFDCMRRFFRKLLLKALHDKDMVAFDSALYLLQPLLVVINGISLIVGLIAMTLNLVSGGFMSLDTVLWSMFIIALLYFNVVFVFMEGKMTGKVLKYIITFPVYNLTWVPIVISGFKDRDKREWVHTLHTRAMDINEVETLENAG